MARNPSPLRVGPQGRIVLPAHIRSQLNIKPGDELLLLVEDGRVMLLTREQLWEKVKERYKNVPAGVSLAQELIAERREEAKREETDL